MNSIYNFLRKNNVEIALLQEVHCIPETINLWTSEWGGKWEYDCGTSNSRGVSVLYNPRKVFVKNCITSGEGRYIILDLQVEDECITVVNVYGPNEDDPTFFQDVFTKAQQFNNANMIIGGDFNTVLDGKLDRNCGEDNKKSSRFLNDYIEENEMADVWRNMHPESKIYTWMRRGRTVGAIQASRIDYFLLNGAMRQMVDECEISAGCRSDHSLVTCSLSSKTAPRGPGSWKMNTEILFEEEFKELVENTVEECSKLKYDPTEMWETFKGEMAKKTKKYCKDRAQKNKVLYHNLYSLKHELQQLTTVETEEERSTTYDTLELIENKIQDIEQERFNQVKFRSKAKWVDEGEKPTKYYYSLEKRNYIQKTMFAVILSDGSVCKQQNRILEEQESFYRQLYTSNKDISFNITNESGVSITQEQLDSTERPIEEREIITAIKEMKNNKVPGCDGIPIEFYKVYWSSIRQLVLDMYEHVIQNGRLGTSARRGIISLLPKKGKDSRMIKNLRPLTLLNMDYKILGKVLANRLKKILPSIIGEQQTGFMEGRDIHTNIRKTMDIVAKVNKTGKEAIIISIDYVKCFDMIEHNAVFGSLRYFGFGTKFIDMIKIFFNQFEICTQNNGNISSFFGKTRGINQGCTISPFIFLLSGEILAHKLKNNPQVKGIKIGRSEVEEIILQFADDSTLFLEFSEICLSAAVSTLTYIEHNTGLTISYEKTTIYRIGSLKNSNATLYCEKPIAWSDDDINMLGIEIANAEVQSNSQFDSIIDKLDHIMTIWRKRNASLSAKVMLINSLMASLFVYKMSVLPTMSEQQLARIYAKIEKFLWSGKPKINIKQLQRAKADGGLKLCDFRAKQVALHITWISKIRVNSSMQYVYDMLLPDIDEIIWDCTLDKADILLLIPVNSFWRDILIEWNLFRDPKSVDKGFVYAANTVV